jgi:hypothetical protein
MYVNRIGSTLPPRVDPVLTGAYGFARRAECCGQETAALGELVAVRLGDLLDDSVRPEEAKETAELG